MGNLEKQWRMFIRQMDRRLQLLNSLLQKLLVSTHLISTLQAELTNLESIYTSYRPLILAATQLPKKEPSFNGVSNKCMRRGLQLFLGDALSWLTEIAMTKDVSSIKKRFNQLIATQHNQQETLVHDHLYSKHHQICHSGEKATHQHNKECSAKDTPKHYHTLQHHTFTVQQPEHLADYTSLHSSKPQRFNILYKRNHHNQNTFISCITSRGSQKNAITH